MTEYQKAKAWRERLKLTPEELSPHVGYSALSIYWMERGRTPPRTYRNRSKDKDESRAIDPWVWRRYKMACAGVDTELRRRRTFDW